MPKSIHKWLFHLIVLLLLWNNAPLLLAQTMPSPSQIDSIPIKKEKNKQAIDTLNNLQPSEANNLPDSILQQFTKQTDTIPLKFADNPLDKPVKYSASDSIIYDVTNGQVYLYGTAKIQQEKVELKAAEISFNQNDKTVRAAGIKDSVGKWQGKPLFTEGEREFYADELRYNFDTRKGKLSHLVTREGEGILRGEEVKKNERDELFAKNAFYTTCNRDHPHFKIKINKVKVIPDKLIVSGPAQLVIADIPTPVVLPFGVFPLFEGRTSGIIFPSYGYSEGQGFYLRDGGYYFAISPKLDLSLTGSFFTDGSYNFTVAPRYAKRYKYSGSLRASFASIQQGDPITESAGKRNDFRVIWNHRQDSKARPNSTFSADVTFGTSNFNREFEIANESNLTNTFTSGIRYNRSFPNTPLRLGISARHNQVIGTGQLTLTLPDISLSMSRIFPFKRKVQTGGRKWYEQIGVSSDIVSRAQVSVPDSTFLSSETLKEIETGVRHNASMSTNFKLLKYINVSPSINYTGYLYPKTIDKLFFTDTTVNELTGDTILPGIFEQDVSGLRAAAQFNTSASMTTKLFGFLNFKKGKLRAIRHEVTPRIGFSYRPDFGAEGWGFYDDLITIDNEGNRDTTRYSIFEDGIYGGPSMGEQASITFGIDNNIQAKVLSKKDTINKFKKIRILDRLSINSSYNFAAEQRPLANVRISGGTNIAQKINFSFNSMFDTYKIDDDGAYLEEDELDFRLKSLNVNLNTSFKAKEKKRDTKRGTADELEELKNAPQSFVNFNIPWNLNVRYTLRLNRTRAAGENVNTVTQTLNFDGSVNLSPNWRLQFNSGYDFTNREFSRTTFTVYRDLHCWDMSFVLVPFGSTQRYEFVLKAKSSLLQDLKLSRRRTWRDF